MNNKSCANSYMVNGESCGRLFSRWKGKILHTAGHFPNIIMWSWQWRIGLITPLFLKSYSFLFVSWLLNAWSYLVGYLFFVR